MKCCATGCKGCCADTDCNDGISCTIDTCSTDGVCSHKADSTQCAAAAPTCDPANGGCIQCTNDSQCNDQSACTADSCDLSTHTCKFANTVCAGKGLLCCGTTCAACCSNSDCQTGGGVSPAISGGPKCGVPKCTSGTCTTTLVSCPINDVCCSYGGCCPGGIIPNQPAQ
jgi:hypothetical protein